MGEKDTSMMLLSSSHLTYLRGLHHLNMLKVTALTDIPHRHLIDWWGQGRGPVQKDFLSGSRAANFRFSYRSFRCPVDHFVNRVQGSVPFFQASFLKVFLLLGKTPAGPSSGFHSERVTDWNTTNGLFRFPLTCWIFDFVHVLFCQTCERLPAPFL